MLNKLKTYTMGNQQLRDVEKHSKFNDYSVMEVHSSEWKCSGS